jgi:hypothetical protein
MNEIPNWVLSVDPGGQTTGVVLARLNLSILTPVDGCSFQRLEAERDTLHTGEPDYCRRLIGDAIWSMLDKHGVQGDDGLAVCVETLVPPRPMPGSGGRVVPMAVWRGLFGAHAVLGAITAIWPDAILVAPDGHDLKKDTYPSVLKGRRPKSWMSTSSSERQHQRAAWSIMLAGLDQAGIEFTVAADGAPPVGVDPGDLAAVVVAIQGRLKAEKSSLALLVEALIDLALAAAEAISASKDPIALRARLAARLDSINVASLI